MITPAGPDPAVSYIYDESQTVDPLGDIDRQDKKGVKKNRAKVGSARPSSLLYTYGPGSVMDLPNFTIMPMGLDEWDIIWDRRATAPVIHAPRLKDAVRVLLRSRDVELRPFPRQANTTSRTAPAATCWPRWTSSSTATPIRTGRILRRSSTLRARDAGGRRRGSSPVRPPPPVTCWPAHSVMSTNFLMGNGYTEDTLVPRPPIPP
jgi:hypothetical protein